MSAKKSTLETLHEMLTELFIEDIKICRSEGIPMSASDKAVIVKFLKDNDVTAEPMRLRYKPYVMSFKMSWQPSVKPDVSIFL